MARQTGVTIAGIKELRRDLRKADKAIAKEFQGALRDSAQNVARDAEGLVHRRGGPPSFTYRGTTRGSVGLVRTVGLRPHVGRFIETGFHPRGSATFVPGRNPVGRALEAREDQIVDELGEAMDRAARKMGWR